MKKLGFLLIVCSLFLVGCESEEKVVTPTGEKIIVADKVHEHCSGLASIENGDIDIQYEIYYTGERLNLLISKTIITSSSSETLSTYDKAYKDIHAHYEGLDHYETEVKIEGNTLSNTIMIDYDNVDIQKLLSIEGEKDNIVEDGIPKVAKWKELGKKFGVSCTKVTEE